MSAVAPIMLLGIGNRRRGDDAVGPVIARALRRRYPTARVVTGTLDGFAILDLLRQTSCAFAFDAVGNGTSPGRIHRFDAAAGSLPARLRRASTHGSGLAQAIELGRVLHRLPTTLTVYAIEGARFDGTGLSRPVARAARQVIARVSVTLGRADASDDLDQYGGAEPGLT